MSNPEAYTDDPEPLNRGLRFSGVWRFIAFLNIGIIIVLSVIPGPEHIGDIFGLDKILHIFAYGFTMFWCSICYPERKYILVFSSGLILMGIVLEIVQGLTGYRMLSVYDMTANSIGVFSGWVLARTRLSLLPSYIEKLFITS